MTTTINHIHRDTPEAKDFEVLYKGKRVFFSVINIAFNEDGTPLLDEAQKPKMQKMTDPALKVKG